MKKDEIFFGDSGLTSTSANFVANLAKEMYTGIEAELNNLHFYSITVGLISGGQDRIIRNGVTSLEDLEQKLKDIAQLKSLIAWLREAITAKDTLITETKSCEFGIEPISIPERETLLTANDVIGEMSIKERNRYFQLETFCSTIGKFIHQDGVFNKERNKLHDIAVAPYSTSGEGANMVIYAYTPTISPEAVDNKFAYLQQLYRENQAQLNSIKHQIETAILKDSAEKNERYKVAYDEYHRKELARSLEIQNKRTAEIQRISNLKIIIPDSLKSIFEKVQSYGKSK
jgi:hypothetical protein